MPRRGELAACGRFVGSPACARSAARTAVHCVHLAASRASAGDSGPPSPGPAPERHAAPHTPPESTASACPPHRLVTIGLDDQVQMIVLDQVVDDSKVRPNKTAQEARSQILDEPRTAQRGDAPDDPQRDDRRRFARHALTPDVMHDGTPRRLAPRSRPRSAATGAHSKVVKGELGGKSGGRHGEENSRNQWEVNRFMCYNMERSRR